MPRRAMPATSTTISQRRRMENCSSRSRKPAGASVVMASPGLHGVGLEEEAVLRDVALARLQTAGHLDPLLVAAPQLERPDFVVVAGLNEDHVPVAEGLQRFGTHCQRYVLAAGGELHADEHAGLPFAAG